MFTSSVSAHERLKASMLMLVMQPSAEYMGDTVTLDHISLWTFHTKHSKKIIEHSGCMETNGAFRLVCLSELITLMHCQIRILRDYLRVSTTVLFIFLQRSFSAQYLASFKGHCCYQH
jgi:hypothetical protein